MNNFETHNTLHGELISEIDRGIYVRHDPGHGYFVVDYLSESVTKTYEFYDDAVNAWRLGENICEVIA